MRLIEALSTDEITDWAFDVVLVDRRDTTEPWVKIALAIMHKESRELAEALVEAKAAYTTTGYRIVVRGYSFYIGRDIEGSHVFNFTDG